MSEQGRGRTERITLRLPEDLALRIRRLAQKSERTLNTELVRAVRAHVEREREEEER